MTTDNKRTAIVIGGSMAGLLAARVLSNHFDQVTLVERDPVHDQPESRKGQPQTVHSHLLLLGGLHSLNNFFPGIEEALIQGGAVYGAPDKGLWHHHGGYFVRFKSELRVVISSRPFLEWHVRQRLLARPNVTLLSECAVEKLETTPDKSKVIGVTYLLRDGSNQKEMLSADLIVDATGRGSRTPQWLSALGHEAPPEEKVIVKVGYATRQYRYRPGEMAGFESIFITFTPPHDTRGGLILHIENDRWLLTLGGIHSDYPPDDEAGFNAFARSLVTSDVYDFMSQAEPLTEIITYKFPANLRRRYEKLKRFPAGYLVLGDAIASFDPVYGQGMTSAALQAEALDKLLTEQRDDADLWRPYFQRLAKVVDVPWQMAIGEDFRFPQTEGKRPPRTDLVNAYMTRLFRAAHHDPVVCEQFYRVTGLVAPPNSLFHPRILWRVLRGGKQSPPPISSKSTTQPIKQM